MKVTRGKKTVQHLIVLTSFCFLSGCQNTNSNSSDATKYGPISLDTGADENFSTAYQIINSRCINCHLGTHNSWSALNSNDKWLNSGYVTRGDPDNSSLITIIVNSGSLGANMPYGGNPIPDEEFTALRNWITNIPP